ncbi:hypothetical protein SERLA73DRAFT_104501 [Serpula lacrymans var. lacrymans S7.3]|uniref:Uncharacterized protein n=2 Tax=Serpula lacrymans var. lacrymans TaxID=341189 RepID=F8PQ67_SERL3|nr:uncharacterized protein SERLADRAFT_461844 [Serpula lacrymans var. lacrymans S7.9]EGO02168.1 hypothetical protein SERLA73DRAFT_104501 [Serpula lacrymans var. lacrymans S7.3]EGO27791.1 hypothetical protein SERLADRAFT_461844 [Serpula lacrymans var. lacrymans S7.9]
MLEIEWKSSQYHSDGRKRSRPKASTVHGWIVKWRATFSGNERLRREGIREMREAQMVRDWKRQRRAARKASKGHRSIDKGSSNLGIFSLFSRSEKKRPRRPAAHPRGSHQSSMKTGSARRVATVTKMPVATRRESEKRPATGSRRPSVQSSRKPSYNSRRDAVRKPKK